MELFQMALHAINGSDECFHTLLNTGDEDAGDDEDEISKDFLNTPASKFIACLEKQRLFLFNPDCLLPLNPCCWNFSPPPETVQC
jgi:hypothetical protein